VDEPTAVFFFDEAHLLFDDAPESLVDKIEQVVRLIRSKGVGVYFVTQNPTDIPDSVLGQLGNRVQHALRAFTPRDQKVVRVAAETLRPNPGLNIEEAITGLRIGEALVSMLDGTGSPTPTERAWILPPASRIGPLSDAERDDIRKRSMSGYGRYEQRIDRESAYETLRNRTLERTSTQPQQFPEGEAKPSGRPAEATSTTGSLQSILFGSTGPRGGRREGLVEAASKSAVRSIGSSIGRAIARGALGSIFGGGRSSRTRR
jgi:DNA helicase HerA-like ATPase